MATLGPARLSLMGVIPRKGNAPKSVVLPCFTGTVTDRTRWGGIKNLKYFRCLTIVNDLLVPFMENVLVVDNGCD